jgi:beta-glucosidase
MRNPSSRQPVRLPRTRDYKLPKGFVFGASTSAYQVEGAALEGGRGASIWEPFLGNPRKSYDSGAVTCDHYNRYREDVGLMKAMGLDAYRFSISWPRVMPNGEGKLNETGLDFYDRLVDELLEAGIDPYVTLYHWDLPLALQKRYHGWFHRETAMAFADYSTVMVKRLGDRIRKWATLNEPEVIIAGYIGDGMAPAMNLPRSGHRVGHHLLLGHALATQAMRAARSDIECGIVLNLVPIDPLDPADETHVAAAKNRWETSYSWYLDGMLKGAYPDSVQNLLEYSDSGNPVKPLDMSLIAQRLDFLGINNYTRFLVDAKGDIIETPGVTRTQMGWEMAPDSFTKMLVDLERDYEMPPVYITENGAALDDTVSDGRIHDRGRIGYLDTHIDAVARAIKGGADVRGYFAWSLMDNLEWPLGFAKTFGLIHVDRTTLNRTVKDSGRWYARTIARNGR